MHLPISLTLAVHVPSLPTAEDGGTLRTIHVTMTFSKIAATSVLFHENENEGRDVTQSPLFVVPQ